MKACGHTQSHTHPRTQLLSHNHTNSRTFECMCWHTCTLPHTHTHTHTHTHAGMPIYHTQAHKCIHAHTLARPVFMNAGEHAHRHVVAILHLTLINFHYLFVRSYLLYTLDCNIGTCSHFSEKCQQWGLLPFFFSSSSFSSSASPPPPSPPSKKKKSNLNMPYFAPEDILPCTSFSIH
ncbi:hypothetical protein GJAV_G00134420 [Gymnothorax javanicus]|nr:hypothetical protein GJAV_G00134420 [Gymnothorax javanicus]